MPLTKSSSDAAFKSNLKAELGAGKPRDRALAIAYSVKRRAPHRAPGGLTLPKPAGWQTRNEARGMMHTGPINSIVPGRTDRHNISVPGGAYVVPAQAVSHLGQSNSLAGQAWLGHMFGSNGPYGAGASSIKRGAGAPHTKKFADGGKASENIGAPVPIVAAGGEFVIHPSIVKNIGQGDLNLGHKILDKWITQIQKDHAKTIKKLPPPAKS